MARVFLNIIMLVSLLLGAHSLVCAGWSASSPRSTAQWFAASSSTWRINTVLCQESDDERDLNWLQTKMQQALEQEEYADAAALRDRIRRAAGLTDTSSWSNLGAPDWLSDRLARLNMPLPTRVQTHALRALERGDDAAVCAPTGSGKTLSYLLPLLTQLSDDLLSEDLSNYLSSFLDGGRGAIRSKGAMRRRAASNDAVAQDGSVNDLAVPTPAVLVVVPTRELGVQVSMVVYRLLGGGSTNPTLQPYTDPLRYLPGGKANMFSYLGPRHVKVAGLWDEQALQPGYEDVLNGVHIIVGTPDYLCRMGVLGKLRLQHVRGLVIDEADACLTNPEQAKAMDGLLRRMDEARVAAKVPPPQTVLAGASLSPALVAKARDAGWVRSPTLVSEFGCVEAGLDFEALSGDSNGDSAARSLASWTEQRVPAGHSHEFVVVEPKEAVATLCRILRARFELAEGAGLEPPRVVIFASSAESAVQLADQLQGALFGTLSGDAEFGLWGLSVLLPSSDSVRVDDDDDTLSLLESSLRVMEMFNQNRTSVLVTTASATRGLDFPGVSDVLNLGIIGSPADYVHRAGRIGRVGQLSRGTVTSILCAAEVPELLALGRTLKFEPTEKAPPAQTALSDDDTLEDKIQALSNTYYLYEAPDAGASDAGSDA